MPRLFVFAACLLFGASFALLVLSGAAALSLGQVGNWVWVLTVLALLFWIGAVQSLDIQPAPNLALFNIATLRHHITPRAYRLIVTLFWMSMVAIAVGLVAAARQPEELGRYGLVVFAASWASLFGSSAVLLGSRNRVGQSD